MTQPVSVDAEGLTAFASAATKAAERLAAITGPFPADLAGSPELVEHGVLDAATRLQELMSREGHQTALAISQFSGQLRAAAEEYRTADASAAEQFGRAGG